MFLYLKRLHQETQRMGMFEYVGCARLLAETPARYGQTPSIPGPTPTTTATFAKGDIMYQQCRDASLIVWTTARCQALDRPLHTLGHARAIFGDRIRVINCLQNRLICIIRGTLADLFSKSIISSRFLHNLQNLMGAEPLQICCKTLPNPCRIDHASSLATMLF